MVEENIMSVEDAAKEWNLSKTTIKRKCQHGSIRSFKVGGRWLIYKDQVSVDERSTRYK